MLAVEKPDATSLVQRMSADIGFYLSFGIALSTLVFLGPSIPWITAWYFQGATLIAVALCIALPLNHFFVGKAVKKRWVAELHALPEGYIPDRPIRDVEDDLEAIKSKIQSATDEEEHKRLLGRMGRKLAELDQELKSDI